MTSALKPASISYLLFVNVDICLSKSKCMIYVTLRKVRWRLPCGGDPPSVADAAFVSVLQSLVLTVT